MSTVEKKKYNWCPYCQQYGMIDKRCRLCGAVANSPGEW